MNLSTEFMLNNSVLPFDHNTYFALTRNLVGIWELILFFVGSSLNFMVLCLVWLIMRNKSRNNSQWFVVSMALADFTFTVIHSPMMFAHYSLNVKLHPAACLTLYITTYATTTVSSLSLLLLNVDKFIYLHKPLHYFIILTKPRILSAIILAWITAFVWALVFLLGPFTVYTKPCDFRPAVLNMYIFFAVFFFTLPIILSLVISIYIAMLVVRTKKEKQIREIRHSFGRPNYIQNKQDNSGAMNQLKTITFVFTTTIWSCISCLPYRIAYAAYLSPGFRVTEGKIHLFYFFYALLAANAAGNPMVTICTQRQYKQKIREVLGKVTNVKFVSSFSRGSTSATTTVASAIESRKTSWDTEMTSKYEVVAVPKV